MWRLMQLTNGNLVPAQLIVKVQGLQQLDQCILQRPDEEGALPAGANISSSCRTLAVDGRPTLWSQGVMPKPITLWG